MKEKPFNLSLEAFLHNAFTDVLNHAKLNTNENQLMGIKISVLSDIQSEPIGLSFRKPNEIIPEMLSDLIFSVTQSNTTFSIYSMLEMTVTILSPPTGGVGSYNRLVNVKFKSDLEILRLKRNGLIDPGICEDFMCLPKCVLLGKYFVDNDVNAINRLLYNPDQLRAEANTLCRKAKVEIVPGVGCSIYDIYKFQNILPDYAFYVYKDKTNGNKLYCNTQTLGKRINLFYLQELQHYIVIKKRSIFFSKRVECPNCFWLLSGPIAVHKCISVQSL